MLQWWNTIAQPQGHEKMRNIKKIPYNYKTVSYTRIRDRRFYKDFSGPVAHYTGKQSMFYRQGGLFFTHYCVVITR